jgi:uncharacterized membrane protein
MKKHIDKLLFMYVTSKNNLNRFRRVVGDIMMRRQYTSPERMGAFSDGVIAIIITIMVLELKAPESADIKALLPLWPTGISYAVSYLFIAIIWINHHHLLRFVRHVDPALLWLNFGHLFLVSLVPFATAWIADSRLASAPVATYAAIFVMVNAAYLAFERAVLRRADLREFPEQARRMALRRSAATLAIFGAAIPVAVFAPWVALAMICAALLFYFRPEAPGSRMPDPAHPM